MAGSAGIKLLRISSDLDHGSPNPAACLEKPQIPADDVARGRDPCWFETTATPLSRFIGNGKAVAIPNGVDVQAVRTASLEPCPHPWAASRDVPIVLAIGRHVKQKNFATLLKAFAKARCRRGLRLIFLGEGQAGESVRLHNLAISRAWRPMSFVAATSSGSPYMAAAHVLAALLWKLIERVAGSTGLRNAGHRLAPRAMPAAAVPMSSDCLSTRWIVMGCCCNTRNGRTPLTRAGRCIVVPRSRRLYARVPSVHRPVQPGRGRPFAIGSAAPPLGSRVPRSASLPTR